MLPESTQSVAAPRLIGFPARRSTLPSPFALLVFSTAYLAAAGFGQGLAIIPGVAITFWPPAGILVGMLLLSPRRRWPWWIGAACVAELAANALWFQNAWHHALLYFGANALEALAAALLIARVAPKPFRLRSVEEIAWFVVLAAGVAPMVGATLIAALDVWIGKHAFASAWPLVWLGDGTGMLVSTPLTFAVIHAWRRRTVITRAQILEACVVAAVIITISGLVHTGALPTAYLLLPPLLWTAARYHLQGAAIALAGVTVIEAALTSLLRPDSPAGNLPPREEVIYLQAFLGICTISALIVAAVSHQRQRALAELERANNSLEARVAERTAGLLASEAALRENAKELAAHQQSLQIALNDAPLAESLGVLQRATVEHFGGSARAAFFLVDRESVLHHVVGMGGEYADALKGFVVDTCAPACGLAIQTGRPVLTTDVRQDPTWTPWLWLAEQFDYRGCWSFPIRAPMGKFVGSLAIYWREPREATPRDAEFAEGIANAASIIIARHQEAVARREAEHDQRVAGDTFRALVEHSPFGMYVIDDDFRVAIVNEGSQKGAFRNVSPLIGRDFDEVMRILWPSPLTDDIIAHFRHTLETGEPYYSKDFTSPRADVEAVESYEWELHRIILPSGRPGVVCYYFDSTRLRGAERAARESEARFRRMADHAPVMIWVTERDSRCTFLSKSWYEFTGQSKQEGLEFGWLDAVHPDDRASAELQFREAHAAMAPFRIEYRLRRADGEYEWALDVATPRFTDAGDFAGYIGSVVDITDRKRAEQSLAWLASIVDTSEDAIMSVDLHGIIMTWNHGAEQIFGYKPEEVLGKPVSMLAPADRSGEGQMLLRRLRRQRPVRQAETVRLHKDGTPLNVLVTVSAVTDTRGHMIGASKIVRDITERKRAEALLRDSNARFEQAADAAKMIVYDAQVDGHAPAHAYGVEHILGEGPELTDITSDWWRLRIHPEDVGPHAEKVQRCIEDPNCRNYRDEYRVRHADGSWRSVEDIGSIVREKGRPARLVGTVLDITERRRAEHAHREIEHRMRVMASGVPFPVWVASAQGDLTFVNQTYCEYFRVSPKQVVSDGWRPLMHPDDEPAYTETFMDSVRRQVPWSREARVRASPTDHWRWIQSFTRPHYSSTGEFLGVVGTSPDITERKKAEELLRKHRENLEELVRKRTRQLEDSHERLRLSERMAAIGTLSAGLGHDMGNLLLPMNVRLETLQQFSLPAEAYAEVEGLRASMEYMRRLTSGLRLLALDPGKTPMREPTRIAPWWAEAEIILRNALPRGIELRARVEDHPDTWVAMSRPALTQAVFNLVQNAGDAMKQQQRGTVTISVRPQGSSILISVADSGPGMSEEVKRRCFEPFFTTKARGASTGLGLPLVYNLVREAGGSVDLQSEPGQGATFTISIPLAPLRDQPSNPSRRALVNIGDARTRGLVSGELQSLAYEVNFGLQPSEHHDIVVADRPAENASNGRLITIPPHLKLSQVRVVLRDALRAREKSMESTIDRGS